MLEAPVLEYKNTKNNEFIKIKSDTQALVATSNEGILLDFNSELLMPNIF